MMQARTVRCCTLSGSRNGRELVQDHARDRMAPYSCKREMRNRASYVGKLLCSLSDPLAFA